jgi:TPR repeat protein
VVHRGGAAQLDPIKPTLKVPGTNLKLKQNKLLSNFAFKLNLRPYTKAAEAGLPAGLFNVGCSLDKGKGRAGPDYPAAADWYKRAADAGDEDAAMNLSCMYQVGRGRAWHKSRVTSSLHS